MESEAILQASIMRQSSQVVFIWRLVESDQRSVITAVNDIFTPHIRLKMPVTNTVSQGIA